MDSMDLERERSITMPAKILGSGEKGGPYGLM